MRIDRLFHVLVVMSAAPAVPACDSSDDDSEPRREEPTDESAMPDAPAASTSDGGAEPCFCDTQTCCDRSTSEPHVLDGFECCWSTTCP